MKTKFFSALALLLIVSTSVMYSCKKKKDKEATIDDFAGSWSVTGSCGAPYTMTASVSGSTLTLSNVYKCFKLTASVSGNTLTIPNQVLTSSTSTCGLPYTVTGGSGTISGDNFNNLSLTYTYKDNSGVPVSCSNTCTK